MFGVVKFVKALFKRFVGKFLLNFAAVIRRAVPGRGGPTRIRNLRTGDLRGGVGVGIDA